MSVADAFAAIGMAVSQRFGGPYWPSQVLGETDAMYDDGGSIITPAQPRNRTCQCQVDKCTDAMRGQDGYIERDVALLILVATLDGGLDTDDRVQVQGGLHAGTYSVQSVDLDTMATHHLCRARAA